VARISEPRELTDARVIRALAHPVRLALIESLVREGPLTATQAGELLGESAGNMSWHLQTLAKYGFVEEVEGVRGRSRPWRLVALGTRFSGVADSDPDRAVAGLELSKLFHERTYQRLREWLRDSRSYPPAWRRAAFASDAIAYLTPEELDELDREMTALVLRYRDRTLDRERRPAGSRPVHLVAFGHPLPPTPSGN
jgi:DNA-binding transcriptional ArsR family regulator